MRPASTSRIKYPKSRYITSQRKNCGPFIIRVPGVVLIISLVIGCKRIVIVLKHDHFLSGGDVDNLGIRPGLSASPLGAGVRCASSRATFIGSKAYASTNSLSE